MPRSSNRYSACNCILYSLTLLANLLGEAAQLSYSDHCSSYVSEAAPDVYAEATSSSPLTEFHTGYYQGGAGSTRVFKDTSSSFSFLTRQVLKTDRDGVLKIAAELIFKLATDGISVLSDSVAFTVIRNDSLRRRRRSWVSFRMEGFWEESSGSVCMVGSTYSRGGEEDLKLKAVLNLDNVNSSATITSLFTGTFYVQKKEDQHFDSISIFIFPNMNYKYSLLVPDEEIGLAAGIDHLPAGLEPPDGKFCALFDTLVYEFSLTYPPDCSAANYNCSPFETQSLPLNTMLFNAIGCSDGQDRKELRVLLQFSNQSGDWSYHPNTTMIGEGLWDKKKNQVHIIACRVSMSSFPSAAAVNDCLIRLQFSFPAMWSIRDRNTLVGKIKKTHSEGDFGNSITARSTTNYISAFPNLNYEYTQGKRVEKFCLDENKHKFSNDDDESNAIYPNWSSPDLSFNFYVEDLGGKRIGSGFGYPLFVGKEMYERSAYDIPLYESRLHSSSSNSGKNTQFNISYSITISRLGGTKQSNNSLRGGRISAEGVYNVETGSLCMVGCRNLVGDDSWDCEIGIEVQFGKNRGLKGSMESTREITDPLYFQSVIFSMEVAESRSWVWRMHLELFLVLISNTFSCIFTALLFFHVRKHPQEAVSVMMIAILALGHAIPLLLNPSSRYQVSVFLEAGKWLEVSEVMGKVITVVTLFLELRILQLTIFSTRSWSVAEKKAFVFAMPVYCVGGFLYGKSFGGVVVDGFLLPQIVVNIFSENEKLVVLMPGGFYIGTTVLRLLPHVYDLWRRRSGFEEGAYVYGVRDMDLYSGSWDLIIVLGCLLLAVIIYVQQQFGGQVIVPRRFRARIAAPYYDKVAQEMTDL